MSGAWDGEVKLWDIRTGRQVHSMRGHSVVVTDVCISPDRRYGLSASADGTVRMWSLSSGQCMAILMPISWIERGRYTADRRITRSEWVVVTPSGYFDASPGGAEQAFFVDGLEVISLKQLADVFYKPKLLKRLLDGEQFSEGLDVSSIAYPPAVSIRIGEAASDTAELVIEAEDRGGGVEDLAVFRNNRIIRTEVETEPVSPDTVRAVCRVPLVPGNNTLYAMAYSRDRIKSFSDRLTVRTGGTNETERELYLLAVGIDDYGSPEAAGGQKGLMPKPADDGGTDGGSQDSGKQDGGTGTRFADLRLAVKDAADFLARYQEVHPDEFTAVHTTLLVNEEAEKPEILAALDDLAGRADSNDRVVVYFSGHGYAMPRRYGKLRVNTYYYVPHDYRSFERLAETGLSSLELMDRLSVIAAEQIFLLFDTCQSGGAEESFANDMFGSLRLFGEDTGMFIMASSAASESSLELGSLDNGLFTHALLAQISPRELPARGLMFGEAAAAVAERMRRIVRRVTMGRLTQTLVATEGEDAVIAEP